MSDLLSLLALDQATRGQIEARNPYRAPAAIFDQVGSAALQAGDNYSTGEKIGTALLSGLLGGAITGLGNDYQGRAENEFLSALRGGSESSLIGPSLFNTANERRSLFNDQVRLDANNRQLDLVADVIRKEMENNPVARQEFLAKLKGEPVPSSERQAMVADLNIGPVASGDMYSNLLQAETIATPVRGELSRDEQAMELLRSGKALTIDSAYKQIDLEREQRDQFFSSEDAIRSEIAKLPSVSQFQAMQRSLPLVESFKDQDSRSSDIGFVFNFIKSLDEGAVRGEELNLAATSNPIVKAYATQLRGAFTGQSQLTPQLKNQMYSELLKARQGVFEAAKKDAAVIAGIAERRGNIRDAQNLYPFDTTLSFEQRTQPEQSATRPRASQLLQSGFTKQTIDGVDYYVPPAGGQ